MPSSFSEYLNNSYDPVSNMIGGWLTEQDAIREARMAELLALEQQRRAAEAATAAQQAQARAAALPLVNPQPVMLPQAPAEAPGFCCPGPWESTGIWYKDPLPYQPPDHQQHRWPLHGYLPYQFWWRSGNGLQ